MKVVVLLMLFVVVSTGTTTDIMWLKIVAWATLGLLVGVGLLDWGRHNQGDGSNNK